MISAPASGGGPGRRPAAGVRSTGANRLAPFGFAFGKTTSPAKRGQKTVSGFPPSGRGQGRRYRLSSPTQVGEVGRREATGRWGAAAGGVAAERVADIPRPDGRGPSTRLRPAGFGRSPSPLHGEERRCQGGGRVEQRTKEGVRPCCPREEGHEPPVRVPDKRRVLDETRTKGPCPSAEA